MVLENSKGTIGLGIFKRHGELHAVRAWSYVTSARKEYFPHDRETNGNTHKWEGGC